MEVNFLQAILQRDAKTNIGNLFYRSIFATLNGAAISDVDMDTELDPDIVSRPLEEEPAPDHRVNEAV